MPKIQSKSLPIKLQALLFFLWVDCYLYHPIPVTFAEVDVTIVKTNGYLYTKSVHSGILLKW